MTMESEKPQVITDFLLEVTQAVSYKALAKAFQKVENDFEKITKQDNSNNIILFVNRYQALAKEARKILAQETNGIQPPVNQIAIFGEMVILRDFCLKRMKNFQ